MFSSLFLSPYFTATQYGSKNVFSSSKLGNLVAMLAEFEDPFVLYVIYVIRSYTDAYEKHMFFQVSFFGSGSRFKGVTKPDSDSRCFSWIAFSRGCAMEAL